MSKFRQNAEYQEDIRYGTVQAKKKAFILFKSFKQDCFVICNKQYQ